MAERGSGGETKRPRNARGSGERLRAEIIAAAIDVLAALGPDDPFSLRAVAKAANIAAPSIYLHFPDRDTLLRAVLEQLYGEQVAIRAAAEAAVTVGGAWERLLARSLASVEFGLNHPGHFRVLFEGRIAPGVADTAAAEFARPLLLRSIELIGEIRAAPDARRVSNDPRRLALLLWAGLHGIVSLRLNKPAVDWPPARELVEQMARAILQPATGASPRRRRLDRRLLVQAQRDAVRKER
jgi:AcrR family transcriptional regulator